VRVVSALADLLNEQVTGAPPPAAKPG